MLPLYRLVRFAAGEIPAALPHSHRALKLSFFSPLISGSLLPSHCYVGLDCSPARGLVVTIMENSMGERMSTYIKKLQREIVDVISALDGKSFKEDSWKRALGGEGISCVLESGNVFERAGVNVSIIYGKLPMAAVKQMRAEASAQLTGDGPFDFFTASISLVIHPHNPMAPTVHLNYRYFEVQDPKALGPPIWWFGGGSDLTPAYLFEDDARHFHSTLQAACDLHNPKFYKEFKRWCDQYFVNTHRGEARGIGGIFFDDLDYTRGLWRCLFAILSSSGALPQRFGLYASAKEWQQLRRGRYVEFNLIHDRGTKFGLHTPSPQIESILVSLPLTARWMYDVKPDPGSPEEQLVDVLKSPREWASPSTP
ncbi:Coproporphyrinogen-III oxidase [Massospora cicadina]|nr:Coproporphyrinogen-III oxidase [Massospora cicadina]